MVADAVLKLREQAIELCRIKREEEALELFERAAEGGDYLSDVYIARHLLSKYCICAGEERLNKVFDAYRSESEPDALLKEAAAEALYVMGNLKKDPFYFKNATQLGCVRAYYRLGYLLYSKGIKHLEEALESWEKGAQAGDSMCVEAYNEHLNEDIKEPIYEGETDQNGLPHGQGVMYYPKTRLKSWCKLKVAPKCYDGQWCHGVKSGKGQMLYYTDNWWSHICYIGSWNNDMPEGTGRLYKSFRDVAEHTLVQIFCYEGDWVAGIREGFGVEYLKDDSNFSGYWRGGKRHGKGILSMSDGKTFRGVWKRGKLDGKSCTLDGVQSLEITLHHSGFAYHYDAKYLLGCQVGSYQIADGVEMMSDGNFDDEEPLIEILAIEDGVVRYRVDGKYSDENSPIEGTIAEGQSVEHCSVMEDVVTIYDEDYEHDIVRSIKIFLK